MQMIDVLWMCMNRAVFVQMIDELWMCLNRAVFVCR